jgi:hypothetical protein
LICSAIIIDRSGGKGRKTLAVVGVGGAEGEVGAAGVAEDARYAVAGEDALLAAGAADGALLADDGAGEGLTFEVAEVAL